MTNGTTLGCKPGGGYFVEWKSTLPSVIPASAGIQVLFGLAVKTKMVAGQEFILTLVDGPA